VGYIEGAGNSNNSIEYSYSDRTYDSVINYYRLKQVDYSGVAFLSKVIAIDNRKEKPNLVKVVNLMGQEVSEYTSGIVIMIYSDGSTK
ncbi:MAG: hypothetical protein GTO02_17550, partial [Candidatus Dadabacteria bacterium]|nr:hypothetical protein [Candidatus Dadabacteria bacterium]